MGLDRAAAGIGRARGARDPEHRLAERLAGDGAGGDAHAADDPTLLDDRRPVAELGGLHGGALAGRAAPETEEIEVVHRSGPRSPRRAKAVPSYRKDEVAARCGYVTDRHRSAGAAARRPWRVGAGPGHS